MDDLHWNLILLCTIRWYFSSTHQEVLLVHMISIQCFVMSAYVIVCVCM